MSNPRTHEILQLALMEGGDELFYSMVEEMGAGDVLPADQDQAGLYAQKIANPGPEVGVINQAKSRYLRCLNAGDSAEEAYESAVRYS
jgi:hypothetical protein